MSKKKKSTVPSLIKNFLDELEWSSTKKYVEMLRERGELLSLGVVDVDVPQIIQRHFACDAKRCIQWADQRPLVDRGCCCRYEVPVTVDDRRRVLALMDRVRENLPDGHRLLDPEAETFEQTDDFGFKMVHDNPLGGCQFNLYLDGYSRCALHSTALKCGENPFAWKPLACSLWPLAINAYDEDGDERLLLTIYCQDNTELFDEAEEEPFACVEDQDLALPHTYQAERGILEVLFGKKWWRQLDAAAEKILAAET